MGKTKTKVVVDTRAIQFDKKVSLARMVQETETATQNIYTWRDKAPETLTAIYRLAKSSGQKVINIHELGIENSSLNFVQKCKDKFGWDFFDIVKEEII